MQHPTIPPAGAAAAPAPGVPEPHYGLPPLPQLPCPDFRGPTPWSNWVIKGRLLAGADSGQQAVASSECLQLLPAECAASTAPPTRIPAPLSSTCPHAPMPADCPRLPQAPTPPALMTRRLIVF